MDVVAGSNNVDCESWLSVVLASHICSIVMVSSQQGQCTDVDRRDRDRVLHTGTSSDSSEYEQSCPFDEFGMMDSEEHER